MKLDEQLRTYVDSIAEPVTAHEARQRTSLRPSIRRPRMALAVGFGLTIAVFGVVTALNLLRHDAPVATEGTAATPTTQDRIEFGTPVLIDTGTTFVPQPIEETVPTGDGSTFVGSSGIRVAAVTETPGGRIAVGAEAVGPRSLAAVWIETDGVWSRVPHQDAFGGLDHELSDIIASGLAMTDVATTTTGTLVAVGIDTRANPARAVAWTSEEGENWNLVGELPDSDGQLASVDLTTLPDGTLIAYAVLPPTQGTLTWLTSDGMTWEPAHQPDAVLNSMIALDDGTVIAVGHTQQSAYDPNSQSDDASNVTAAAWWSTDSGRTWTESVVQPATTDAVRATTITDVTLLDNRTLLAVGTRHSPEGINSTNGLVNGESSLVVWESTDRSEWRPIRAMTDTRPLLGPKLASVGSSLVVTATAVNADRTVTVVYGMTLEPMTQELLAELDGQVHTTAPGRGGVDLFTANPNRGVDLWRIPYW